MSAPAPTVADMIAAGSALAEVAQDMINGGEIPSPADIARTISGLLVKLVPVDDLKQFLDEADRDRIDDLARLAAEAKLGPRPAT